MNWWFREVNWWNEYILAKKKNNLQKLRHIQWKCTKRKMLILQKVSRQKHNSKTLPQCFELVSLGDKWRQPPSTLWLAGFSVHIVFKKILKRCCGPLHTRCWVFTNLFDKAQNGCNHLLIHFSKYIPNQKLNF